jgi:hypothetical protein
MQMSAAIESLFSVEVADADWVNDAAACILRVLGPSTADWWAVDWHATLATGMSSNLAYNVDVLDGFGEESRAKRIIFENDIGVHFTAEGMLAVGEGGPYWVRLRNGFGELNVTMTVSDQ